MIDIGRVRFDVPDGLAWECTKCGKCCREQPADLNGEEIETIEEAGYKDFYIENGSPYPIIKRGKNGGCVFLTEDNLCEIYEIRPTTCRIQPFGIKAYDFGEEKIIAYIPSFWIGACEGIHEGEMKKEALTEVAKSLERAFDDLKRFAARESGLAPDSTRNLMKVNHVLGSARRREEGAIF